MEDQWSWIRAIAASEIFEVTRGNGEVAGVYRVEAGTQLGPLDATVRRPVASLEQKDGGREQPHVSA